MKKVLARIGAIAMSACLVFGVAACGNDEPPAMDEGTWTIDRLYAKAQELGFEGTLDELIDMFKGNKGDKGDDGIGISKMEIDENGHLIVTYSNGRSADLGKIVGETGATGPQGPKGDKGDTGPQGEAGEAGESSKNVYELWLDRGYRGTLDDFFAWIDGAHAHFDPNGDCICDYCNEVCHIDRDGDGYCDDCHEDSHIDKDGDGLCDHCDLELSHADKNGDGLCDNCRVEISHVDKDKDCMCDNCSESLHVDKDGDNRCDKCQRWVNVTITIWGPGEQQEFLKQVMNDYAAQQGEDYPFTFEFGIVSEADAYSNLNTDVKSGANVYAFANDQLVNLFKIGALARVDDTTAAKIKAENSDAAYEMGVLNNALYAYPYSADNGFFMFYDSSVIKTDPTDLDAVLEDIRKANKKFIVEYTNAWYAGSMMYGAGGKYEAIYDAAGELERVETNLDQKPTGSNYTYGALGAEGWASLARNEVVLSGSNDLITSTANEGNLGAVITGTWMAGALEEAWGDGYAATTLPQWTSNLDGKTYDWWTFAGGELYGVNPNTDPARLAESHKIAEYLSSKAIQDKRFDALQIAPSNTELAAQKKVTDNVALGALLKQMDGHAVAQKSMPQNYWDTFGALGEACKTELNISDPQSLEAYITTMVAALRG